MIGELRAGRRPVGGEGRSTTSERPGSFCPFFLAHLHWKKNAAVAVEADDPALVPTRVGGRRVSETTVSIRDSSLADLIGPGEHMCF